MILILIGGCTYFFSSPKQTEQNIEFKPKEITLEDVLNTKQLSESGITLFPTDIKKLLLSN